MWRCCCRNSARLLLVNTAITKKVKWTREEESNLVKSGQDARDKSREAFRGATVGWRVCVSSNDIIVLRLVRVHSNADNSNAMRSDRGE